MRDDEWLRAKTKEVCTCYFPELNILPETIVRFKGRWKNKFGHIKKLKNKNTEIAVNGFFKDERVPEYIIELTLAHELVHYMHGFHSPLPKLFNYPHQGGIVNRELKNRGFKEHLKMERKWVKGEWKKIVEEEFPKRRVRRFFGFRFI